MTQHMTQFISECKTIEQANQELAGLRLQEDFIAGRVLDHSNRGEGFKVQALFPDYDMGSFQMDGCKRALVFDAFLRQMAA